jgi:hypothetical protein
MCYFSLQLCVITVSSFMWSFASHATTGDSILLNLGTLDWPGLYQTALSLPLGQMVYTGLFSTAFCLSAEVGFFACSFSLDLTNQLLLLTLHTVCFYSRAFCSLVSSWLVKNHCNTGKMLCRFNC